MRVTLESADVPRFVAQRVGELTVRPGAGLDAHSLGAGRTASDQQPGRHLELRDARDRAAAALLRLRQDRRAAHHRARRARRRRRDARSTASTARSIRRALVIADEAQAHGPRRSDGRPHQRGQRVDARDRHRERELHRPARAPHERRARPAHRSLDAQREESAARADRPRRGARRGAAGRRKARRFTPRTGSACRYRRRRSSRCANARFRACSDSISRTPRSCASWLRSDSRASPRQRERRARFSKCTFHCGAATSRSKPTSSKKLRAWSATIASQAATPLGRRAARAKHRIPPPSARRERARNAGLPRGRHARAAAGLDPRTLARKRRRADKRKSSRS